MTTDNKLADALRGLLEHVDRETCRHESTHRGGVIWTICDDCGEKWADDRGGFVPYSEPASIAAARLALAEHDAQPASRDWRLVPILATPEMDAAGKKALSDNGVDDVDDSDALVTYHAMLAAAPQPAPAPVHEGLWRCSQCGEPADAMSSRWRWSGKEWQHHHGAQVGHVNSRYFGSDAAPVQTSDDLVPYLQPTSEEIEASCNGSDAHQPAPAADGAGELPPLPPVDGYDKRVAGHYSAASMHAYARAAIAARTCPLPAHWRMAIEERGIENPKALEWIEQRARELAKEENYG